MINFLPTLLSILIPIITVDKINLYTGIVVGIILMFLMYLINKNINIQRKKEAIPEILATGYYMNFIDPLSSRIGKNTRIIKEHDPEELVFSKDDIEVNVFKPDLKQLPKVKKEVNKFDNFSIKDNNSDKSFSVRGQIIGSKFQIYDFPNTLFSLQDYFINEFGDEVTMKDEYTDRFYKKLLLLINNNIKKGRVELSKIELVTP